MACGQIVVGSGTGTVRALLTTNAGRRELSNLSGTAGADEHYEHVVGTVRALRMSVY